MEIISYVGGRPDNRLGITNFIKFLPFSKGTKKRQPVQFNYNSYNSTGFSAGFSQSVSKSRALKKPVNFSFALPKINIYPKKLLRQVGRFWWILPFALVVAVIPPAVIYTMNSLENTTSPLVLKEAVDNEYDFLNSEITRFALQSISDISEDGSIEGSVASYTFKQPVSYTTYTVKSGDTISGISKRFGLKNISTIIAVNNIENVRSLNAGKKLTIPSVDGLFYKVKGGDSVQAIAKKYDVTVEDLLDVNDLDSELLVAGNNLFIPGAKLDKTTLHRALGDTFTNPLRNVKWRLTSRCGWRANPFTGVKQYHPGIDMAISQGTPIYAALNGKVVACGWSNIYGNYVIIDHGNGYQSLYGHMYKKLCTLNQEVSTSTKIGLVGSTGYSTGAHLHFTVYKNGKVVDPLTLIK